MPIYLYAQAYFFFFLMSMSWHFYADWIFFDRKLINSGRQINVLQKKTTSSQQDVFKSTQPNNKYNYKLVWTQKSILTLPDKATNKAQPVTWLVIISARIYKQTFVSVPYLLTPWLRVRKISFLYVKVSQQVQCYFLCICQPLRAFLLVVAAC